MQILIRVSIDRALLGSSGQVPAATFENGEGGAEPDGGRHVGVFRLRGAFGTGGGESLAKCRSGFQPFVNGAAMHLDFRGGGGNGAPLGEGLWGFLVAGCGGFVEGACDSTTWMSQAGRGTAVISNYGGLDFRGQRSWTSDCECGGRTRRQRPGSAAPILVIVDYEFF